MQGPYQEIQAQGFSYSPSLRDSTQQKEKGKKRKRKASGSPSLPPASQPTTQPTSYKNRTPLIATGIDPKFKTQIQIMSELRQYHPSLRVFQIRQSSKGWIFIGDTPKDFAILQSETKMKQVFGPKVKVSLPKSYHSADASKTKILIFKGVSKGLYFLVRHEHPVSK